MATEAAGIVLRHIRRLAARRSQTRVPERELLAWFCCRGDTAAFEELVRRHGPMVLRVGRRLLSERADAEDVLQATFLTLSRKAASIRRQQSVAAWLHGVAYRLALRMRTAQFRRAFHERQAPQRQAPDPLDEITLREALALLDEELAKLPERLRAPLVLCYLEGVTRDEAAGQLGWSRATIQRRLDEGRERLARRLARRGLTL